MDLSRSAAEACDDADPLAGFCARVAGTAGTDLDQGARLLKAAKEAVSGVDERLFGPDADPIQRQIADAARAAFSGGDPA